MGYGPEAGNELAGRPFTAMNALLRDDENREPSHNTSRAFMECGGKAKRRPEHYTHSGRMVPRSADFQSAESRISNPQALGSSQTLPTGSRRHSRFGNLRYFRLTECV